MLPIIIVETILTNKKSSVAIHRAFLNDQLNYFETEPSFTLLLFASTRFVALNSTTMLSVKA